MTNSELWSQGKIEVKGKQIQVEKDATKKAELQNEMQVFLIKKQIETLKNRISQIQK